MVEINERITFNEFDSKKLGLYLIERDAVSPSEKEIVETIPFMQGVHDFSMLLGERIFDNRLITYTFFRPQTDYYERKLLEQEIKRKLMMNGILHLYDSHDESFYWYGKCKSVEVDDSEENRSLTVKIVFDVYPFMLSKNDYFDDVWDTFNFNHHVANWTKYLIKGKKKIFLINNGDTSLSPTIITDSDMKIILRDKTYTFKKGENKDFLMKLERGINELTIYGNGVIKFRYRTEVMG